MSVITHDADLPPDTKASSHAPARPAAARPADKGQGAGQAAAAAPGQPAAVHGGPGRSGTERAVTSAERFAAFGQANTTAVMESGRIWLSGCHALSHEVVSITRAALGQNLGLFAPLAAVRSRKDAVALHAASVRSLMGRATQDAATLTGTSISLAGQSFAPIAARIDAAASLASAARA